MMLDQTAPFVFAGMQIVIALVMHCPRCSSDLCAPMKLALISALFVFAPSSPLGSSSISHRRRAAALGAVSLSEVSAGSCGRRSSSSSPMCRWRWSLFCALGASDLSLHFAFDDSRILDDAAEALALSVPPC